MDKFLDRYEIHRQIGQGGMAQIFSAFDTRLRRQVAIKVVKPEISNDDQTRFLFHREARSMGVLRNEHIIILYDYSGIKEQQLYLIMELIDGGSLFDVSRTLDEVEIAAFAMPIAAALTYAHQADVIHRDLKPENVLYEKSGRVVLSDFGIAKAYQNAGRFGATTVGRATELIGTPEFLAPEQLEQEVLGPAVDVFALGSMLYLFACGRTPFLGDSAVDTLQNILDNKCPRISKMQNTLSDSTNEIIMSCIDHEPGNRPHARELHQYFLRCLINKDIYDYKQVVKNTFNLQSSSQASLPVVTKANGRVRLS